ncbi:riboflavin synthase domain-like protein [Cylindrobasidium torrendii FP15055 ss-10]|uniref:NADPH-dependent diflavin oxidoreductase 1 n=1 Tax=Cylindrobasidium torrendii FP15055 ss-10 TaxID=1314674 RepID=A0A0D7BBJ2_9AGAR|nr:riboflavin synthase domain-like protein [Cylindrobasidium torrendii FP15055 ss-10]
MSEPLILFATESGNAQEAADYLSRQLKRISLPCRSQNVESYSPDELIHETVVIFLVSTTGSGVEPRAMTPLWNMLLRSDLPADLFDELHFAVFGLGDSSYERFCWAAKKLSRRLGGLGAIEICERGEGDDQHMLGTDGALFPWTESLLCVLAGLYDVEPPVESETQYTLPSPRATLSLATAVGPSPVSQAKASLSRDSTYHNATMKTNARMTADDWYQDVRRFEFTFDEDIEYQPGDVAVLHPLQLADEVESFLTSMGWGNIADEPYSITHVDKTQSMPSHVPAQTTLRELFTRYLSFTAVPRRAFFLYLRHFTTDSIERDKLDEFLSSTPEGAEDLYDYVYKVRRTIFEILGEFHGAREGLRDRLDYLFDIFPPIRPREFSIASCAGETGRTRQLELCVAIVKYRTRLRQPRRGLCTAYMADMKPGDQVMIGLKKGFIKLPDKKDTPIICIGPGTGVAPMRSLILQRISEGIYNNTLYFGCRSTKKDHHFQSEWESLAKEDKLTYRVACSRDGPEGVKRTYVQDLIEQDKARIWELIEAQGAWVYISGSSNKMPTAVKASLALCAQECGGMVETEAKEYIRTMEREGRLTEECWS